MNESAKFHLDWLKGFCLTFAWKSHFLYRKAKSSLTLLCTAVLARDDDIIEETCAYCPTYLILWKTDRYCSSSVVRWMSRFVQRSKGSRSGFFRSGWTMAVFVNVESRKTPWIKDKLIMYVMNRSGDISSFLYQPCWEGSKAHCLQAADFSGP